MPEVSVCEPAVRVSDLPRGLQPREKLLKAGAEQPPHAAPAGYWLGIRYFESHKNETAGRAAWERAVAAPGDVRPIKSALEKLRAGR